MKKENPEGGESYLSIWRRLRKRVEQLAIEDVDQQELDKISKLLERVQKGEMGLWEGGESGPIIVNIYIPGTGNEDQI